MQSCQSPTGHFMAGYIFVPSIGEWVELEPLKILYVT
jgi:hypothetical protein